MKRAAAAAISLMTGLAMLTGCSRAELHMKSGGGRDNPAVGGRRYRRIRFRGRSSEGRG